MLVAGTRVVEDTVSTFAASGEASAGVFSTQNLAIAALIVAILAVPITIWATRRWGNRRAKIALSVESTPLLPAESKLLAVTYRDLPVADPHMVSVSFINTGPRDISSQMFDPSRPFVVSFDATFYGITSHDGGVELVSQAIGSEPPNARVEVRPGLLRRKAVWTFSAVLSGPVTVSVHPTLIDTEIVEVVPASRSTASITLSVLGLAADIAVPVRRTL
jgi:hypothetical protein